MLIILFILAAFVTGMIKKTIWHNQSFAIFCLTSIIFMAGVLFWIGTDDPALEHDYVKEDVIQKVNGSYPYLDIFNKADKEVLKKANQKIGDNYKGKINKKAFDQVWNEIAVYRQAIEALDRFNVICDLPDDEKLDMNYSMLNFTALREVTKIYQRYFLFKLSQGRGKEAATDLCRLYRVTRKGMTDSTILINKIIFTSLASQIMDTVYVATLNKKCDKKTLRLLKENFTILDSGELSLKRPIIAEYLILKNTMREEMLPDTFLNSFTMEPGKAKKTKNKYGPASYLVYYFGFKPNKSLTAMKKYYELLIEAQENFPVNTTKAELYFKEYNKTIPVRNMVGWILNAIAVPQFGAYFKKTETIKVKSDLLSLAIHKKLKQPIVIKDIYTNDSYEYKIKNGFIAHPGQDGKFGNEDDIILGKKPSESS